MTRTVTGLLFGLVAFGLPGFALAQPYPMQSDPLHPSTGNSAFPNQGPLPMQQQGNPFITPGVPAESAPGVPNGIAADAAYKTKRGRIVSPMSNSDGKPTGARTR